MYLVQILLPMRDNKGNSFPKDHYIRTKQTLTKKFGGLTAYTRAPAEGVWKDADADACHDDIVIFEVMLDRLEKAWWEEYKKQLEALFAQDEIIIRVQDIILL